MGAMTRGDPSALVAGRGEEPDDAATDVVETFAACCAGRRRKGQRRWYGARKGFELFANSQVCVLKTLAGGHTLNTPPGYAAQSAL